jgi:hypothetical protein
VDFASLDRQGMTDNLHVQGYLAYWDALRRRRPNLVIDSCASGGRRNDLETMRRAVPLHPTDYPLRLSLPRRPQAAVITYQRIYRHALSAAEVAELAKSTTPRPNTGRQP